MLPVSDGLALFCMLRKHGHDASVTKPVKKKNEKKRNIHRFVCAAAFGVAEDRTWRAVEHSRKQTSVRHRFASRAIFCHFLWVLLLLSLWVVVLSLSCAFYQVSASSSSAKISSKDIDVCETWNLLKKFGENPRLNGNGEIINFFGLCKKKSLSEQH